MTTKAAFPMSAMERAALGPDLLRTQASWDEYWSLLGDCAPVLVRISKRAQCGNNSFSRRGGVVPFHAGARLDGKAAVLQANTNPEYDHICGKRSPAVVLFSANGQRCLGKQYFGFPGTHLYTPWPVGKHWRGVSSGVVGAGITPSTPVSPNIDFLFPAW